MSLIECVPNISEGRREQVIQGIAEAVRRTPGVRLLHCSADAAHNRSVLTLAGTPAGLETAVLTLFEHAINAIDLRVHDGVHPRMGAVDVVPFVPLDGATMAECVRLASTVGSAVAARFKVPIYLYEEAASRPSRRKLEAIRRGGFEGLPAKMADEAWAPDFGPRAPHPSAGASAVGARFFLIAFNVNLASRDVSVAKAIAAAVRESSGGLPAVKAMGVAIASRDLVQVSMNLTDYRRTSLRTAFEAVATESERRGVSIADSEIIGLVPRAAVQTVRGSDIGLRGEVDDLILERRL